MAGDRVRVDRRTLLRGLGAAVLVPATMALPACGSSFTDVRLRIATGGRSGVYYLVGTSLARVWQQHLGLVTPPVVLSTNGSVDNLNALVSGAADVVFCQVDAAVDQLGRPPATGRNALCALGRVYDELVQVVVPAAGAQPTPTTLSDLRDRRVSIGAPASGVAFIADRLLRVAGVPRTDRQVQLGIDDSVAALERGEIDAFFWTGGIPTDGIERLSQKMQIRLLDLQNITQAVRQAYPVYAPGTVPAGTYDIPAAITTLQVRNALLVASRMPDDLAYALTETVYTAQDELASTSPVALRIDLRSAVGIQPVPLHPGALAYFRDAKNP